MKKDEQASFKWRLFQTYQRYHALATQKDYEFGSNNYALTIALLIYLPVLNSEVNYYQAQSRRWLVMVERIDHFLEGKVL